MSVQSFLPEIGYSWTSCAGNFKKEMGIKTGEIIECRIRPYSVECTRSRLTLEDCITPLSGTSWVIARDRRSSAITSTIMVRDQRSRYILVLQCTSLRVPLSVTTARACECYSCTFWPSLRGLKVYECTALLLRWCSTWKGVIQLHCIILKT